MGTILKKKTKVLMLLCLMGAFLFGIEFFQDKINFRHLPFLNGVFMTLEFCCCLVLLRIKLFNGYLIAMAWALISIIRISLMIFIHKRYVSLPGLTNTVFYAGILSWLFILLKTLTRKSIVDKMTALLNKKGIISLIQNKIENKESFDIIFMKISNIRLLNETFGMQYGDELKKSVANKLKELCSDDATVSVFDGANFVIVTDKNISCNDFTKKILHSVREKIFLSVSDDTIEFYPEAFCGFLVYHYSKNTSSDFDAETLIMQASTAETVARKEKSEAPVEFENAMIEKLKRSIEIDKLIREAILEDWFFLVYQPQFTLKGKKLRGFETLIRLKTPDGTFVSPGEFIPVAENSDLILKIDDYVLRRSMMEMKELVAKNPSLIISINVSAKNISNENFPQKVLDIVKETEFPSENLEIEITEYCLAENMDITIENIKVLRKSGIQIALDDFGTGYTSLNYLSKLPINLLKIDKSLIDDIEKDEKRLSFVNSIISIGHLMGCEVISEGVEYETQIELLKANSCDFVQGFVWGKPQSLTDARSLVLISE